MKCYRDEAWLWNGLLMPYKISERHPDTIHIEPRLQVTCYHGACHAPWWPDHRDQSKSHFTPGHSLDWRRDMYALHATYPEQYPDPTRVFGHSDFFAEIGRHVLEAANLTTEVQRLDQAKTTPAR